MHHASPPLADAEPPTAHRGVVAGVALIATGLHFFFLAECSRGGVPVKLLAFYPALVAFVFLLAKIAPRAAGFDRKWLPSTRREWLWFPAMVLALLAVAGMDCWLASFREDWFITSQIHTVRYSKPFVIIVAAVVATILGPVGEEVFWRGYLLAQLQKLMHWSVAVAVHSLLFSLAHPPSHVPLRFLSLLLYGVVFGVWRVRFRSILPLIAAHMILNGVVWLPTLTIEYRAAVHAYPKCRQIELLQKEPAEVALPALVALLADPDDVVSVHAMAAIERHYSTAAEPHLKTLLRSRDMRAVDRALFATGRLRLSGLKQEVRRTLWAADRIVIQLAATCTLSEVGDEEGLEVVAKRHPDSRVRHAATTLLTWKHASSQSEAGPHKRP